MRCYLSILFICSGLISVFGDEKPKGFFTDSVISALNRYCFDCHDPEDSEGDVLFLEAKTPADLEARRSEWRSVAEQLRNRTMPPAKKKLQPTEEERLEIANWIKTYLRESASKSPPYAAPVTARRLNRLEYDNTVRDLLGVMLGFSETFPMESGGGEGFDNNGETLFTPPMLMERFLEASGQIVDAAIVSPALQRRYDAKDFKAAKKAPELVERGQFALYPLKADEEVSITLPIFTRGKYQFKVGMGPAKDKFMKLEAKVDGVQAASLGLKYDPVYKIRPRNEHFELELTRGLRTITFQAGEHGGGIYLVNVEEVDRTEQTGQRSAHFRLLGFNPGERPLAPRKAALNLLKQFLPRAFRRPVKTGEPERYLALYDRAAKRGDPFEERIKLMLKGVLVSPDFLFRIEEPPASEKLELLSDHELASRLSYFLWSSMPDPTLFQLAREGRLQDEKILQEQVERMLDDPKVRVFTKTFIGQWLGTKDVGGRVAPTQNDIQHYYTPEVARAMRTECELFFQHLISENRPVLDLLDSNYTFMNGRLAKFYQRKDFKDLPFEEFTKVSYGNDRRGGLVGMGAVLAATSHYKQTSPVLRGAWVLDVLFGTPVPPPPPDIPPLVKNDKGKKLTVKESLEKHRDHTSCAACHNLIDPVGFALENFDFLGRWRETADGKKIYTKGTLPTGESFDGPEQLRQTLLLRKDVFLRQLIRKTFGYALGRALVDQDEGAIERIARQLEKEGYGARDLILAIVQSSPFRYKQKPLASEL
jgi:hypothetical protein